MSVYARVRDVKPSAQPWVTLAGAHRATADEVRCLKEQVRLVLPDADVRLWQNWPERATEKVGKINHGGGSPRADQRRSKLGRRA